MSLHAETLGRTGPDVVLIHGWGLHGGIWGELPGRLAGACRVTLVDLPGHGRSGPLPGTPDIDEIAEAVAAAVPSGATWVGWSLGGMVALAAASRNTDLRRLVVVGTNPRFVASEDWPGMAPELLATFAADLAGDYRATLNRFLALQTRGAGGGREALRDLRARLFAHGEPDAGSLRAGLRILAETDLRPRLASVAVPALVIHGSRDTLVPGEAAERSAEALGAELAVIDGAGHAPFLSHFDEFAMRLESFIDG